MTRLVRINILLYGRGSQRSEYANPAIWLYRKRSDISRIAVQGGNLKKPVRRIKIKIHDKVSSVSVLQTTYCELSEKQVTMQSEVAEEILYEMTTELQVFTVWRSLALHLSITFQ